MPRRKDDSLTPIEVDILAAGAAAAARGETEFHGFGAARVIAAEGESRRLAATGTVYRALHRLEQFGFLESRWEEPAVPRAGAMPSRANFKSRGVSLCPSRWWSNIGEAVFFSPTRTPGPRFKRRRKR